MCFRQLVLELAHLLGGFFNSFDSNTAEECSHDRSDCKEVPVVMTVYRVYVNDEDDKNRITNDGPRSDFKTESGHRPLLRCAVEAN